MTQRQVLAIHHTRGPSTMGRPTQKQQARIMRLQAPGHGSLTPNDIEIVAVSSGQQQQTAKRTCRKADWRSTQIAHRNTRTSPAGECAGVHHKDKLTFR